MNEDKCAKASTNQIIIMALGITALALLMLVSITGAAQSTNIWFHKGSELMSSEKYNEAIIAFDKSIEINPHDSYAWAGKGVALGKLGKSDEAITAFEKAIEINPRKSIINRRLDKAFFGFCKIFGDEPLKKMGCKKRDFVWV